jgi:SAM-dependent methyltransferase
MQNEALHDSSQYAGQVAKQIEQYQETEQMHDLPRIYDYWAKKYNSPRIASVIGYDNLITFYAAYFRKSLHESDSVFLMSIGSGDCSIEIEIVKDLISTHENNFFFICLELSPILIEKARKKIDAEGLGDKITVAQIDINKWNPEYSFAGVMAHHALHHFLNLEQLFGLIKKNLAKNGRFITCDMIGRNGHMKWPESLLLTRKIWERIPRKYKFNHQFQQVDDYFNNLDCSTEGFEGIRAQDILPLLVKMFSFEVFYGYGNLIDPFIDRGYGPNYDPDAPLDAAFLDYIQALNEKLISEGVLKPTAMAAVMVNEPVPNTKIYKHWSPAFAIRDPKASAPVYDMDPLLEKNPFRTGPEDDPLTACQAGHYPLGKKVLFISPESFSQIGAAAIPGQKYLKYGWGYSEAGFTWSISEDAALIFPLEKKPVGGFLLELELIPYRSPLYSHTLIDILVNDKKVETLRYDNKTENNVPSIKIHLPPTLVCGRQTIEIVFLLPNRRQPQFETGDDRRSAGVALISATISEI